MVNSRSNSSINEPLFARNRTSNTYSDTGSDSPLVGAPGSSSHGMDSRRGSSASNDLWGIMSNGKQVRNILPYHSYRSFLADDRPPSRSFSSPRARGLFPLPTGTSTTLPLRIPLAKQPGSLRVRPPAWTEQETFVLTRSQPSQMTTGCTTRPQTTGSRSVLSFFPTLSSLTNSLKLEHICLI